MAENEVYPEESSLSDSEDFSDDIDNEFFRAVDVEESKEALLTEFVPLTPEMLIEHMLELVNAVNQVTDLPKTLIRMLLEHYRWDKDALIEQYFEHNRPRLFASATIMPSLIHDDNDLPCLTLRSYSDVHHDAKSSSLSEMVCDICCVSSPPSEMLGLGCGHFFCRPCWLSYLQCKIMDENQGSRLACPAYQCENLIADESVTDLLLTSTQEIHRQRVYRRFQKLVVNSFVLQNRSLTWCPGVDCGYAVRAVSGCVGDQVREVVCANCSECFCFACGNPWHEPVLCKYLKRWLNKVEQDAGTSHWIAANTKECPNCKATIEKNGGCNHMSCRNADCKYEFCWVCLGSWDLHGSQWYVCNSYKESTAKQAREAQDASRAALSRYLFYHDRYANHEQSRRFEKKLYESVQSRMVELEKQGMSWIDVKFVKHVVDVLCSCRRTLMYTYVFAYFLESSNQSLIFEANQSDLEQATEQLSEFLEWDLSTATLVGLKQKLQDKSRYCEQRRKVLLEHVAEGYEKDLWTYRVNV
ncbi:unnamed protein product [Mesocestoides corti]|uniref:RBR-type E3 ubiquitin transferase n=2 Tax=Mesocestoides corti TaxID=53468 RepID=A0A158QWB1_MESCO|nr:unnamed protein product [Mesocestoides corti]